MYVSIFSAINCLLDDHIHIRALKGAKKCLCKTGFQDPNVWQNRILLALENELKKTRRSLRVPLKLSNDFERTKMEKVIDILKPETSNGCVHQETPTTSEQGNLTKKEFGELLLKLVKNNRKKPTTSVSSPLESQKVREELAELDKISLEIYKRTQKLQSTLSNAKEHDHKSEVNPRKKSVADLDISENFDEKEKILKKPKKKKRKDDKKVSF